MPIYDYECPACGHRSEEMHPVAGSSDPIICPCGTEMKKVPSRVSPPQGGPTPVFFPNRGARK